MFDSCVCFTCRCCLIRHREPSASSSLTSARSKASLRGADQYVGVPGFSVEAVATVTVTQFSSEHRQSCSGDDTAALHLSEVPAPVGGDQEGVCPDRRGSGDGSDEERSGVST